MEKILIFIGCVALFVLFFIACLDGVDREARRQCSVAIDNCAKYADAGACDPKYLKICEGVEDEE